MEQDIHKIALIIDALPIMLGVIGGCVASLVLIELYRLFHK